MADQNRIYFESKRKVHESVPKIIVNLVVAFVVWLLAILVFQPLGDFLGNPFIFGLVGMKALISGVVLIALVIILLKILKNILMLTDGISDMIAVKFMKDKIDEEKLKHYRSGFRGLGYVLLAIIAYMFFLPLLAGIFTALAGIVLVLLVIWAIFVVVRVGNIFSEDIEQKAAELTKKFEKTEHTVDEE
ncbi:conserved hypothetical protein [Methanococcus vannielii SB]|uniref:Succinate dehydrogenase hydrophobic anchor subunit n=1 Tax=Methanococcus vannielii (strain ATCC 35089 / DSM 1224 / JCM 13029 / OCM 148 / SB) TaxID=406327 RepID=A6USP5_METVS|nr:hypothetical protein [Methanococcus vannielii]ABR55517.1 conserved hypothetical protein [Methanococcus vannielii SB]